MGDNGHAKDQRARHWGGRMSKSNIKQEALKLVESLPENATWEDLMYEIYVRQAIEAGL
jgi:hypothetical protein